MPPISDGVKGLTDGEYPGFIEFVHNVRARGKSL